MNERERRALNGESKISAAQLFVLIVLFELSSSLLIFQDNLPNRTPGSRSCSEQSEGWLVYDASLFYQVNPDASPYETLMNILETGWLEHDIYLHCLLLLHCGKGLRDLEKCC
ncbi:hypothetical protein PO124_34465 [Bacillus licheniformis]|nr:hypothetical protein [Bacillus licheniformis]